MDTKLKRFKPFLAWLCFFLGVSIVLSLAVIGISQAREIYDSFGDITAALRSDYKEMSSFREEMASRFEHLLRVVDSVSPYDETYVATFPNEGENLIYYAVNTKYSKTVTNTDPSGILRDNSVTLPEGYDYYLYFDGSTFFVQKDGKAIDVYRNDSEYQSTSLSMFARRALDEYKDLRVLLIVKKDIVKNPYAFSSLYQLKRNADSLKWMNIGFAASMLIGLVLLVIAFIRRKSKREFDRKIAGWFGFLWFEVKVGISILAIAFLSWSRFGAGAYSYYYDKWYGTMQFESIGFNDRTLTYILMICCFWWFYSMLVDLINNKKQFFRHNSVTWLIKCYRRFENKKPFQKAMLWRVCVLISAETILVILTAAAIASNSNGAPFALIFIAIGIYLMYRYLRRFGKTVWDVGVLIDRIESLKNGDAEPVNYIYQESDLNTACENLALIQDGVQKTVDERIKSEHMKAELVTNVSHDLKTPLTSIISYADLLSREEDLPEHVREYIRILSQKSDRLKGLIQDLFDLSKASSGAMELEMEPIDIGKLVRQTLADMDEQIGQSDLTFRVNIPDTPVTINSDGKKLYRVFQNLFSNVLKYAMKGSRVYVDLTLADDTKAIIEIKNISNYEMNFNAEEILERFVRGDKTRSTEGSGLGLAIAQSFTIACGGSFDIKIDGDLFKVRLAFNIS